MHLPSLVQPKIRCFFEVPNFFPDSAPCAAEWYNNHIIIYPHPPPFISATRLKRHIEGTWSLELEARERMEQFCCEMLSPQSASTLLEKMFGCLALVFTCTHLIVKSAELVTERQWRKRREKTWKSWKTWRDVKRREGIEESGIREYESSYSSKCVACNIRVLDVIYYLLSFVLLC